MFIIDKMNSATGWTVIGNDTDNLSDTVTSTNDRHVCGTSALEFDKVNGAGNTTVAGAYKTVDFSEQWRNREMSGFYAPYDRICWFCYVGAVTDVASTFVRLGTSASHYLEWRFPDSALTAGAFTLCNVKLGDAYCTGKGCNWTDIDYLAVGVVFDAQDDTLADIAMDQIFLAKGISMGFEDQT